MEAKKIFEVEESVRGALEALPGILRSKPVSPSIQRLAEAVKVSQPGPSISALSSILCFDSRPRSIHC